MSAPTALGAFRNPPLIPKDQMEWGANALSAPTTPNHRMAKVDRSKVDPQTVQAAEGMEAMFLDYMMKVMRNTVPKNDLDLESPATEIYRGMMDSETAQRAAKQGGIGLADQIIAYLESQRYTGKKEPHAEAPTRTGGTPDVGFQGQSLRK